MAKIKKEINKRGMRDEENAELVKKFGGGGVFFPAEGRIVVAFFNNKKSGLQPDGSYIIDDRDPKFNGRKGAGFIKCKES